MIRVIIRIQAPMRIVMLMIRIQHVPRGTPPPHPHMRMLVIVVTRIIRIHVLQKV
jgi:hypothetical protein